MESPGLFWFLVVSICALLLLQKLTQRRSPSQETTIATGDVKRAVPVLDEAHERKDGKPVVVAEAQIAADDSRHVEVARQHGDTHVISECPGRDGRLSSVSRKRIKEEAQVEADEPVTVYTLNAPYEAEVVKNALRGQGIPCELDGEHQAGLSDILEIGVLVRARDADRARRIIHRHEIQEAKEHSAARSA
jgi:hypothetical protein